MRDCDWYSNQEPGVSIEGVVYTRNYSEFVPMTDRTVLSINGFPPCLQCFHVLRKAYTKGYWICPECGTTYDTPTLVTLLQERGLEEL